MATLTATELERCRQALAKQFGPSWTKAQINAALQAIEDRMVTTAIGAGDVTKTIPQLVGTAIDDATSPVTLTAGQKKVLFALWAELKYARDK